MCELAVGPRLAFGDEAQKGTRCESGTVPQRYAGTNVVISTGRKDWEATASRKRRETVPPASPKTCRLSASASPRSFFGQTSAGTRQHRGNTLGSHHARAPPLDVARS